MFSTFTTDNGKLIIRTEQVQGLADIATRVYGTDAPPRCVVSWLVGNEVHSVDVLGTAQENFDRLKREELEMVAEAQKYQQRQEAGLPVLPIPRGRAR